jgi:hypothetical protein
MVAAPLSPERLLAAADLAGYAEVTDVRDGRAELHFSRVLKGRPKGSRILHRLGLSRTVTVRVRRETGSRMPGTWSDEGAYQPGFKLLVHLSWDEEAAAYKTCWWNGVSVLETPTASP